MFQKWFDIFMGLFLTALSSFEDTAMAAVTGLDGSSSRVWLATYLKNTKNYKIVPKDLIGQHYDCLGFSDIKNIILNRSRFHPFISFKMKKRPLIIYDLCNANMLGMLTGNMILHLIDLFGAHWQLTTSQHWDDYDLCV